MKKSEIKNKIGGNRVSAYNKKRLMIGFIIIVLLFTTLLFRVAYLQVVKGDKLAEMADSMQKIDSAILPTRGQIYDANRKPIAETVKIYKLYGYTNNLYKSSELKEAEKNSNLKEMCKITKVPEKEMKKKFTGVDNLALLASGLDQKQVDKLEKKFGAQIVVKTESRRIYPNKEMASQIIGNVDGNMVGRSGIESKYNEELTGTKGRAIKTADSQGNTLSGSRSKLYKPRDGYNVITTIDEVIQNYTEEALEEGMKKTKAESINCIVMNPKTGDVLAVARTPGYDPNSPNKPVDNEENKKFQKLSLKDKNEYLSNMWSIPAVSSDYEPGSTFKLLVAAAAIDSGAATEKTEYYCNATKNVDGVVLHCWGAAHGKQNLKEAVGNSCNPAMATVALDMGSEKLYRYMNLFGLNDRTNIDLPGETSSIIKKKTDLTSVDLATTGYGHGLAITPIQILTAVNSLGNDGWLMKPRIVSKIEDKNGKTIKEFKKKKVRQVISKKTADEMRDIMEYYVRETGGTIAYIPGYRVGGKTGTAYIAEDGKYSSDTIASFVGMAPMDDPEVSIIVIVNRSKKANFGATAAGPIMREILEKTLEYKGVERKYSEEEKSKISDKKIKVPDVTNINSNRAKAIIKSNGFNYIITPDNGDDSSFNVIDQYPKAGTELPKGSTVYIYKE